MTSVQTEINKYFKTKKNYSGNGKESGKIGVKTSLTLEKESTNIDEGNRVIPDLKSADKKSASSGFGTNAKDKTSSTPVPSPFSTPKRKCSVENTPDCKRNRVAESPASSNVSPTQNAHKSAKKRILLDESEYCQKVKLSPKEIKEKLGKCNRLDELRARLLKLNQCEDKIKNFKSTSFVQSPVKGKVLSPRKLDKTPRKALFLDNDSSTDSFRCLPPSPYKLKSAHPQLQRFKALDVDVPVSPKKSPYKIQSPLKASSPSQVSCHQRFSQLVEPTSTQLTLPNRYQIIREIFRAVDTIVSLLHNRQELITFAKLKPAVQEMLRKAFYESHLGQIKTIFPLSYFFKQDKMRSKNSGSSSQGYELTVSANMNYKTSSAVASNLISKFDEVNPITFTCKFRKMDSIVLVERRKIFYESLLEILKQKHQVFLQSLDPPIKLEGPLKRWHPEFLLEEVDEPRPSILPTPPEEEAVSSAKKLLDKARDSFSVNNRMKTALEKASDVSTPAKATVTPATNDIKNDQVSAALKGVSLSLIEKIRAKEAANAAKEMTRSSSESRELEMLSRLPEIARIVRNVFVTEKKAALPWEVLANKITCSYSSILVASEVNTHLNMLIKEVPRWCTVHKVRSGTFLKIDKTKQLQDVVDKLNKIIKART